MPVYKSRVQTLLPAVFGLMLSVGLPGVAWPQAAGSGIITGRVINAATESSLEGAMIRVEGMDIAVATERDGSYRLLAPAGERRLTATYTGLDEQTLPVLVPFGGTVRQDIGLTSVIYQLDTFVVASEREGNALPCRTADLHSRYLDCR